MRIYTPRRLLQFCPTKVKALYSYNEVVYIERVLRSCRTITQPLNSQEYRVVHKLRGGLKPVRILCKKPVYTLDGGKGSSFRRMAQMARTNMGIPSDWQSMYRLALRVNDKKKDADRILVLLLTLPSPSTYMSSLIYLLCSHVDSQHPVVPRFRRIPVVPVSEMSLPLDMSSLYVGSGNPSMELRPSPWLNPFMDSLGKRRTKDNPLRMFRKYEL